LFGRNAVATPGTISHNTGDRLSAIAAGGLLAMLTDSLMLFAFTRGGKLAGLWPVVGYALAVLPRALSRSVECFMARAAPTIPASKRSSRRGPDLLLVVLTLGSTGVKARQIGCTAYRCGSHELQSTRGRWDRNRTGNLRFWSTLPFVHQRSATYTSTLNIAHCVGPK
jgi:hypothetical protein